MPQRDGKGPRGQGPETGKGTGAGRKDGFAKGPSGFCICPNCGEKVAHQQGTPCYEQKCPKCDTAMTREQLIFNLERLAIVRGE